MTRRLIALTVGVLGLAAAPVVASATHSAGEGPKKDFVRGTGHFEGPNPVTGQPTDLTMHVSARSGPSGAFTSAGGPASEQRCGEANRTGYSC